VDTLVLSRLLYPDRPGGHSLEEWGYRLGFHKGSFNDFNKLSHEMLEYCEQDCRLTAKIFDILRKESKGWGYSVELEHSIADIMARQQRRGMFFNVEEALRLEKFFTEKIKELDEKILEQVPFVCIPTREYTEIKRLDGAMRADVLKYCTATGLIPSLIDGPFTGFMWWKPDLDSSHQQKTLLEKFGWKPQSFTDKGNPQLDDTIKDVPVIGAFIHERNVLNDRLKKVSGLLGMVEPATGRIHGGANPCGTPTGRMRHKRIVNIPRIGTPFGKELRSLFTASPGYVLIGYDASSLELRILAHYIGSEEYNKLVTSTDKTNDAHTFARDAAGGASRDVGKTINYALIYGAKDPKLGSIVGGGRAEGAKIRQNIFRLVPNFKKLLARVEKAVLKGYLVGLDNRHLYVRSDYKALNTLIQGGGAIFMKTVAAVLDTLAARYQELGDAFKVLDMHDEAQWEIREELVGPMSELIEQAFETATKILKLRCPQAPEIKIGRNWMETH
jgi:DNA polymerase I-like protein with 3'-5' exonuclease and polymerase domains